MIHYDQEKGLSDLAETVSRAVADLRGKPFDSVVAEGVSGLIVASPVALALGKPLVVVRKDSDLVRACYHVSPVENAQNAGRSYLFLDDYVGEGKVYRHVRRRMNDFTRSAYAGTYEFRYRSFTPADVSPVKFDDMSSIFAGSRNMRQGYV